MCQTYIANKVKFSYFSRMTVYAYTHYQHLDMKSRARISIQIID
jgi:hypothetical protein